MRNVGELLLIGALIGGLAIAILGGALMMNAASLPSRQVEVEVPEAISYVEKGHARGKVVVTVHEQAEETG